MLGNRPALSLNWHRVLSLDEAIRELTSSPLQTALAEMGDAINEMINEIEMGKDQEQWTNLRTHPCIYDENGEDTLPRVKFVLNIFENSSICLSSFKIFYDAKPRDLFIDALGKDFSAARAGLWVTDVDKSNWISWTS